MGESQIVRPAVEENIEVDELELIDILLILAKRKKLIFFFPLVVAALTAGLTLIFPNVYKASVKLLPPQQSQSGAAAMMAQLGGFAGAAASAAGIKNPSDLYMGMLRSRTIAEKIIAKYDLKKVYATDSLEYAIKTLAGNTVIATGKDGIIAIDVEDEDKHLVPKLANAYADELLKLTNVILATEASQKRIFFEQQLVLAKDKLADAEIALKGGLEKNGVISVDGESRTILEIVSRLRSKIALKEIQLNAMRAFVTPNNQEFKRTEEELGSLRGELLKLENGRSELVSPISSKKVGLESIKIVREVKYREMLYELLARQYEAARLEEAKDTSIIQVLDFAVEPERKSKPKRLIIALLAAFFTFFISLGWAFLSDMRERALVSSVSMAKWDKLRLMLGFRN